MKVVLVVALAAVLLFAVRHTLRAQVAGQSARGAIEITAGHIQGGQSDKLVAITGMDYATVQKIVADFATQYSDRETLPDFEIQQTDSRGTIISFSDDMNFELFCFFVNYVQYPKGESTTQTVRGWSSLYGSSSFLTQDLSSKTGMFFLSPNDQDYDRVWFVTSANVDYMISFAGLGGVRKTGEHCYDFQPAPKRDADKPAVVIRFKSKD